MTTACPWCREPLGLGQRRAEICPHCGRPLRGEAGELRDIDLRFKEVEAAQCEIYRQMLVWGSGASLVLFLLLPLLHASVSPALVVPLVLLAHMLAVRIFLFRRARRLLGTTRRIFVRWITRLGFIWVGAVGYGLTALPLVGVVPGVVTYVGLTAGVHHYTRWSLARERARQPLALWEKLVLVSLVLLTVGLLLLLSGLALLLGWSVSKLIELFSEGVPWVS
jgi:hypothetical protein